MFFLLLYQFMLTFALQKFQKMFQSQIIYAQVYLNDEMFKLLELGIELFDVFRSQ